MPTLTLTDIKEEVREYIQAALKKKGGVDAESIPDRIMAQHKDLRGEDAEWFRIQAFDHVVSLVRRELGLFKEHPKTPEQLVLAGYEYLQKGYLVERNGKSRLLAIAEITKTELLQKASEYRTMARGCVAHALEIERYVKEHLS